MSTELVAALVGAVAGGILALLGGIAQVFIQGWVRERGKITYDVVGWQLGFQFVRDATLEPYAAGSDQSWKEAKNRYTGERSIDEPMDSSSDLQSGLYSFTVNFLNKKGTNAAVLEYSVEFLRGKQTLVANLPAPEGMAPGQAVALPAETVTGINMAGLLNREEAGKVLSEADRVQFTARLSSGPPIRVELDHLSQDWKGAQKGGAT